MRKTIIVNSACAFIFTCIFYNMLPLQAATISPQTPVKAQQVVIQKQQPATTESKPAISPKSATIKTPAPSKPQGETIAPKTVPWIPGGQSSQPGQTPVQQQNALPRVAPEQSTTLQQKQVPSEKTTPVEVTDKRTVPQHNHTQTMDSIFGNNTQKSQITKTKSFDDPLFKDVNQQSGSTKSFDDPLFKDVNQQAGSTKSFDDPLFKDVNQQAGSTKSFDDPLFKDVNQQAGSTKSFDDPLFKDVNQRSGSTKSFDDPLFKDVNQQSGSTKSFDDPLFKDVNQQAGSTKSFGDPLFKDVNQQAGIEGANVPGLGKLSPEVEDSKAIWGTDGAGITSNASPTVGSQEIVKPTIEVDTIKEQNTDPQIKIISDTETAGDYTGSGQGWGTGKGP